MKKEAKKIRWGMVGLQWGTRKEAFEKIVVGSDLVAVCDTDKNKVDDCMPGIQGTTDFREFLSFDLDAVYIATPDFLHVEQAIHALESGKHVFLEKPIAVNIQELNDLVKTVERTGKKFSANTCLRWTPRIEQLHNLVKKNVLGDIFYMEGDYVHEIQGVYPDTWRAKHDFNIIGGGGIHLIAQMVWLINDKAEEVMSYGNRMCWPRDEKYNFPDCIVTIIKFENGCVAKSTTLSGCRCPNEHRLEVFGTHGSFNLNSHGESSELFISEKGPVPFTPNYRYEMKIPHQSHGRPFAGPLVLQEAIVNDTQPAPDIYEAAQACSVCLAAYESYKSGKPVKVAYPWEKNKDKEREILSRI